MRVFHFDIPTVGNFGDLVLFEAVRRVFNGCVDAAGRPVFQVVATRPLRQAVDAACVDAINASADLVLVGGGGLLLADTNANLNSGWQWNIPLAQLARLGPRLALFAIGQNRFPGQADFAPPFAEHLAAVTRRAAFFGLRNRGSVDDVATRRPAHLASRLAYQPCPTTLAAELWPDLAGERDDGRRIAIQCSVDHRQRAAGFSAEAIFGAVLGVAGRLAGEGWRIDSIPHHPADLEFAEALEAAGAGARRVSLRGDAGALERGLAEYAEVPLVLGTRGHAQLIAFGMGAAPVSLAVHAKLRYFADDIGHRELTVDPAGEDLEGRLYRTLMETWERRAELRADWARRRAEFKALTGANLARIADRRWEDAADGTAADAADGTAAGAGGG
ncbi:MAG: polysaccharide pyruvyl transferase family protein, partial [Bifidobacteriaceae bacterium]|nr:polysaccharide pyruvyl transferase family protein [Bifidobacteriaceae bacterium]